MGLTNTDDSAEKRREKIDRKMKDEAHKLCQRLACKICKAFALKIAKSLAKLPRRSTDQSHVIDEEKHLVELNVRKGEIKRIQREKGVEQQCRLMCQDCGCLLAYRPKPVGEPCKFLYVLPDVVEATDSEAPVRDGPRGAWPAGRGSTGACDGDGAREGDWACAACGASPCFAGNMACFKCGAPRPADAGGVLRLSNAEQLAKYQKKEGEWLCSDGVCVCVSE